MTGNGWAHGRAGKGEMRRTRSSRLTGPIAEQLLDGHGPDTPVTWLLAAAAAPGRAEEIAGETAARAAFAAIARTEQAPPLRPPTARRSLVSRLIAAKAVALVLLAAGATGGVALAANAQFAPVPEGAGHPTSSPRPLPTPSAPTSAPISALISAPASAATSARASATTSSPSGPPSATPLARPSTPLSGSSPLPPPRPVSAPIAAPQAAPNPAPRPLTRTSPDPNTEQAPSLCTTCGSSTTDRTAPVAVPLATAPTASTAPTTSPPAPQPTTAQKSEAKKSEAKARKSAHHEGRGQH
jgi:hypothetical protein